MTVPLSGQVTCMVEKANPPEGWPRIKGDYVVGDPMGCTAVVTCGSNFGDRMVKAGAAISGRLMTTNIGIELIVANIIANPNIRFLIVAGREVRGHQPGNAISCLCKYGLIGGRIANALGPIPFIENLSREAIGRFREQVRLVEMIDVDDEALIAGAIAKANAADPGAYPGGPMIVDIRNGGVLAATQMWYRLKNKQ